MNVRPAESRDFERLAVLQSAAYLGQFPATTGELARRRAACLVSERGGAVAAALWHWPVGDTAPGHQRLQLMGEAADFTPLLAALLARLPAGVSALQSVVCEDHRPQMHFLAAAGFRNAHQSWGAHLELKAFDFAPFEALEERLFLADVEVSEARPPALHGLFLEGLRDLPRNPTTTPEGLDPLAYQAQVEGGRVFTALDRDRPIAFAWLSASGAEVESEFTVTAARWRGRGVATLVKARALDWAQGAGYARASTGGTLLNLPMLRVNARLGYRVEPMWITWVRAL